METGTPIISNNRTYDLLKFIAQIVLPATGALYFGLSEIWGFPNGAEVVGTITVVVTFLGALLGVSAKQYSQSDARFDGTVEVVETDDTKHFELVLDGDPYDLDTRDELVFRVNKVA